MKLLLSILSILLHLSANAQMGLHENDATAPVNTSYPSETVGSIDFPTAFKWNRNGPNGGYWDQSIVEDNIFRPFCRNIAKYNLRIYNRNGFLVYESSQVEKGWDGYLENGEVAYQGVYIWKATGLFIDGTPFSKIGDVTFLH